MIRLFTTSFFEPHERRRLEYQEALRKNLECSSIDQICVLDESGVLKPRGKLVIRNIDRRPMYADYFAWISEVASPNDISIVSNADIYFDREVGALETTLTDPMTVFALARWDSDASGTFQVRNRNDSQDSWIFRGKVRQVSADFPIGVPRCDNRIAAELENADYNVINPAFSIRSYHLHAEDRSGYPTGEHAGFVSPPHRYLWPQNLLAPHATLLHNLRYRDRRLGWRIDSRMWSQRLKLHLLRKLRSVAAVKRGSPKS